MPMLNYGLKIHPQQAFVKDCIHDVFLNIWTRRQKLSQVENVKAYLFTSLRLRIIEQSTSDRAREQRQQHFAMEADTRLLNIEQLKVAGEQEQEKRKILKKAVDNLSKRQKEAVYLKFFNGFTNEEIADIMGVNKQSVYNLVSQAIKNMEGYLG